MYLRTVVAPVMATTELYAGPTRQTHTITAMSKTPEQWLDDVAAPKTQGVLKLFLGYAPGVGKTYVMLSEAIRRYSRGEDVATGVIETHGRKGVADLAAKLDSIPRKKL